ncbi:MAG: lamin tail domain-containing protein, partial [Verrucomicrobiota bacterium]|nr:lamin tail domain-containing protein [Verrucomicrobiota bacterium]
MADNGSTLADEDGEFPDWIEIANSGTEPVDLAGWHLTDDETNLTKWTFPGPASLAGGQSLVVFASGKNRHRPGRQLHTNFALNQSGEFLALVAPDGATLASRFSPYPPQELDLSYGVGLGPAAVTTILVEDDAQALLLVPSGPVD